MRKRYTESDLLERIDKIKEEVRQWQHEISQERDLIMSHRRKWPPFELENHLQHVRDLTKAIDRHERLRLPQLVEALAVVRTPFLPCIPDPDATVALSARRS